jgi:LacI family transcriptional regulator
MPTTMQDIAEKCGVSLTTVSRALQNKGEISPETKDKILKIAREMDYTPNVPARILAGGKSNIIGLVVADNSNPYYAKLIRGVEDCAKNNGYGIILYNTDETMEQELGGHQMLLENRVDGLLITSIISGKDPLLNLKEESIPFVLLNRYIEGFDSDWVRSDNRLGAYLITKHLCEKGHHRIAHITGDDSISSVRERLEGYKQALQEFNIEFDPDLISQCDLKLEGGYHCATSIVENIDPLPTAIFAYSDLLAIGVLKALGEKSIEVPGQIALTGYDNIEFSPFIEPPLTTVDQFAYEIGKLGMEILIEKMAHRKDENWSPRQEIIEPKLIIRRSSG